MDELVHKAKEIIEKNLYITLATVGTDNIPLSSPVYAAYDEQYNFYWASGKHATHSENICQNNIITFVIFDSSVPWGEGKGVYVQAKVFELEDKEEIIHAFTYRYGRINKPQESVQTYMGDAPRRIYKAVPEKFWISVDAKENGYFVDKKVEVQLL